MRKKFIPISVFGLIFCLSFMGIAHAADAPIAEILTVVPGASVSRDGQTLPLERFSALHLSDTVSTDTTGRVRILFADDSTVDLGANSSLDMREFADSGAQSVFNVHLLQGVARVVTGRIVEANPQGFAVITPEATIGIRGTILSVRTGNGKTTTFVENTTRAVYVNDINVPGGNKITFPGDSRPVPIQPEDRRSLSRDLAFRGGAGAAAAAPEPSREREVLPTHELADTGGFLDSHMTLADMALSTQGLGDSLNGANVVAPTTANYVGSTTSNGNFTNLTVGFTVNLGSGAVYNGYMNGVGAQNGAFSVSGGTGDVLGLIVVRNFTSGTPNSGPGYTYFNIDYGFTPGATSANIAQASFTDPSSSYQDTTATSFPANKQ